jgi:hypothetical protein
MKTLSIIALVLITLVVGFFTWSWYGWHRMKTGYEVNPKKYSSYLQAKLSEDFGFKGFEQQWLQNAWVNGFQDHTYLFVVAADSPGLREAIEKATGKEPIQVSFFRSAGYLGPSTAPGWWNTSAIDAADARFFEKDSTFWRFTWMNDRLYIVYCTT